MEVDLIEFLMKHAAACFAGFFMGFERQFKGKPAGLKTNMLVSIGACAFIVISLLFADIQNTDMTRIVSQVVVAVGFLGAGVILHTEEGRKVEGLATAATIWCSAAAGSFAGFGLYLPLLFFTLFVIVINLVFGYLSEKVDREVNGGES